MSLEEEIVDSGVLFWCKAHRRGEVVIPLEYLTEDQKQTLISGLASNRYKPCWPDKFITALYAWYDQEEYRYLHVTDIELSPKTKRKISPRKTVSKKSPYKDTLTDMKRLQDELRCGEVDEVYVEEILIGLFKRWKPWNKKEWRLKRDKIIGTFCGKCGSQEKLVLQHTVRKRHINSILYELVGERFEEVQSYVKQNRADIELSFPDNLLKVPVCPKCGSSKIQPRIRGDNKGTYVCNKTKNYEKCNHQFTDPDYGYDEKDIKKAEKERDQLLRRRFCIEQGLMRIAAEKCLEEIITYLNLVHTKTLCESCAMKEDKPFEKRY
jgi:hypothetical protein